MTLTGAVGAITVSVDTTQERVTPRDETETAGDLRQAGPPSGRVSGQRDICAFCRREPRSNHEVAEWRVCADPSGALHLVCPDCRRLIVAD